MTRRTLVIFAKAPLRGRVKSRLAAGIGGAAALGERPGGSEIVICDGGSGDGTVSIAHEYGARVVAAPRGRGPQMIAGAQAARGDWLLFLHADTRLAAGWSRAAADFCAAPAAAERAA